MKLLTFLGLGRYETVTYVWADRSFETNLFPEALAHWLQPAEMLVLLTPEARGHQHWHDLQTRLAGTIVPKAVDIPSGKSEVELWQIFERLAGALEEGDEVVFDVTHAYRSLPVLSLLAASFLRVARGVKLKRVLYGAFEARDANNGAPVFDLTPFIALLDWVTATDKFLKSGDGGDLAGLLKDAHGLPWRRAGAKEQSELPRHLHNLGTSLEKLTRALLLTRPGETAEHAGSLERRLPDAAAEAARFAQPFALLLDRTRLMYGPLAGDSLASQRDLVRWYVDHGHALQAVTLAREWLVSWAGHQLGRTSVADRDDVERAVNEASVQQRGEQLRGVASPLLPALNGLTEGDVLATAWNSLADLRNDLAHCGFRERPRSADSILQATDRLLKELDRLPA